jgi:hypothetical protein
LPGREAAEAAESAEAEGIERAGYLPFPHQKIAAAPLVAVLAFDSSVLADLKSFLALLSHR